MYQVVHCLHAVVSVYISSTSNSTPSNSVEVTRFPTPLFHAFCSGAPRCVYAFSFQTVVLLNEETSPSVADTLECIAASDVLVASESKFSRAAAVLSNHVKVRFDWLGFRGRLFC